MLKDLHFVDADGRERPMLDPLGRPTVIAFLDRGEDLASDEELRPHLRGIGARMLRITGDEIVLLGPDDAPVSLRPLSPVDLRAHFGVSAAASLAVVLVDGQRKVRARHERTGESDADTLLAALAMTGDALRTPFESHEPLQIGRREVLVSTLIATFAALFAEGCAPAKAPLPPPALPPPAPAASSTMSVKLHVNGLLRTLEIEPRVSLLDALRDHLMMTGTKKGCDMGQCGACTVLIDGRRVLSCLTLAAMVQRGEITTIEGLAKGEDLHPVQRAFVQQDGFQCGYCTPGQIMSAVGLLAEGHAKTDDEVREMMSGNICRCGAYTNIVAAVQAARGA